MEPTAKEQSPKQPSPQQSSYNVAFCYLPFVVDGVPTETACKQTLEAFTNSSNWKQAKDRATYLFRYICEKYDPAFPDCQCHHFQLLGDARNKLGIGKIIPWHRVRRDDISPEDFCDCSFLMPEVSCYVFSTSVNILVFKLHFATDDPLVISTQLAGLKNVQASRIIPCSEKQNGTLAKRALEDQGGITILEFAKSLLAETGFSLKPEFFFYANEGRKSMNVLMHVESDQDIDVETTLFYLGNCYSQTFDYEREHSLPTHMHWASPTTAWAYSSEALACLTVPQRATSEKARDYVTQGFRFNFLNSYQFLYLMLLHQKYEYYRLLMSIGAGERREREQLEQFHRELEFFRANFVFSRVSETQQYQYLYDVVSSELKLAEMDRDVAKPIKALRLLRQNEEAELRLAEEAAERESDRRIGNALNIFTLLAGISALFDGLELVNTYIPLHVPTVLADWISILLALVLIALMIRTARQLQKK